MFEHEPVLLSECIDGLNIRPSGIYVDCTLGGAGHSSQIYRKLDVSGTLVGFDQDENALEAAVQRIENINGQARFITIHSNFRHIKSRLQEIGIVKVDGILMDLGVSSHQLDEDWRGFSYQKDARLDMRMNQKEELSAWEAVNNLSENELKKIIFEYGEERWAARIAATIVKKRIEAPIETTFDLVDAIKAAIPAAARREGPHPAKRTFQALRIYVNDELGVLKYCMEDAMELLNPGGRLCIITFHSLEDRIVKTSYAEKTKGCTCSKEMPVCVCKDLGLFRNVTKKPIIPSNEEVSKNPRARSAKLRIIEKI